MDKSLFLEAGKIINTHGVHGEIKIDPWTDSPAILSEIKTFYIDGEPVRVNSSKIHKNLLITSLEGVTGFDKAVSLKNKIIYISRDEITLDKDHYFIVVLIGLRAVNDETGEDIGIVTDVLSRPANDVYIIKKSIPETGKSDELLIPAVPDFIKETNIKEGYIKFRLIEGM